MTTPVQNQAINVRVVREPDSGFLSVRECREIVRAANEYLKRRNAYSGARIGIRRTVVVWDEPEDYEEVETWNGLTFR